VSLKEELLQKPNKICESNPGRHDIPRSRKSGETWGTPLFFSERNKGRHPEAARFYQRGEGSPAQTTRDREILRSA